MPFRQSLRLVVLDRDHLPELEAIERLARTLGFEAFTVLAHYLAETHVVSHTEEHIMIRRLPHDSMIGMSDLLFKILRPLADRFAQREPRLEETLAYQSRDALLFFLPLAFWQQLVNTEQHGPILVEREGLQTVIANACRSAQAVYPDDAVEDHATFDTNFLAQRVHEGMSLAESVQALVAFKRIRQ